MGDMVLGIYVAVLIVMMVAFIRFVWNITPSGGNDKRSILTYDEKEMVCDILQEWIDDNVSISNGNKIRGLNKIIKKLL